MATRDNLSEEATQQFRLMVERLRPFASAQLIWDRLLSSEDKQRLGDDLENCWKEHGTVGIWRQVHKTALEPTVIDLGESLDLLASNTADWLRREFGIDQAADAKEGTPKWCSDGGELVLEDEVIRQVRVMKRPSKIQQILDAFQKANWPISIPNPLTLGEDELHQAVKSLNKGLHLIRFHAAAGAKSIYWQRT